MAESDEEGLLDGMVQLAFEIIGIVSRAAAAHELSLTQLRVLAILRDREPTMSGLAAFLGLDRSTITGLVDRAVARGLVQRKVNDADRRSARIALTERGAALADEGRREIAEGLRPVIEGLSATDGERLAKLLDQALGLLRPVSEPR